MRDRLNQPRNRHLDDELAETITRLTEGLFRIGPYRFGLDPIIGLVPGIGDFITALVSVVLVQRAISLGLPKVSIARMVANILIDAIAGAVPFLGDLFDFAWKANTKNLAILRGSLRGERGAARDWLFLAGIFVLLLAALALPLVVLYYIIRAFLL